jgi:hypothetical protein
MSTGSCPLLVCRGSDRLSLASRRDPSAFHLDNYVLAPTKDSPGLAGGDFYMLYALDRLHVLRPLES